jgi:hypothetical protein
MVSVDELTKILQAGIDLLETRNVKIQESAALTRGKIEKLFAQLLSAVENRKRELLQSLDLEIEHCSKIVEEQRTIVQNDLAQISELKDEDDKATITRLIDRHCSKSSGQFLCMVDMHFSSTFDNRELIESINGFGELVCPVFLPHSAIFHEYRPCSAALTGEVKFNFMDICGKEIPISTIRKQDIEMSLKGTLGFVACEVFSEIRVMFDLINPAPNGFSFNIRYKGKRIFVDQSFEVSLDDGAPFQVLRKIAVFSGTNCFAVLNEEIFIHFNRQVTVFSIMGKFLRVWSSWISDGEKFKKVVSMAAEDSEIFVSDASTKEIHVFEPNGALLRSWPSAKDGYGNILEPGQIVVRKGLVFVFSLTL